MSINIPQNTKVYLTAMLENKIQSVGVENLFENVEGYKQKYLTQSLQEKETKQSDLATGYGSNFWETPKDGEEEDRNTPDLSNSYDKIKERMRQRKEEKKEQEQKQKNLDALQKEAETGGFGGDYADPKSTTKMKTPSASEIMFGDMSDVDIAAATGLYGGGMFGKWLQKLAGSNSMLGQLGGQIEDLTGKSWFDTQVANISKGQLGLVAQGAGSPWVPFYMPGRSKVKSQRERQDDETDELIRQRKRRDEAQKYGIPYP